MTQHAHTGRRSNRGGQAALALIGAFAALAAILVPLGAAKPPSSDIKKYSACLQSGGSPLCSTTNQATVVPGGQSVQLTLTIANDPASNQSLGSVNLTAPSQLPIDRSLPLLVSPQGVETGTTSSTLELRNLNLANASSVTVTFFVTTPCSGTGLAWQLQAKQSNNFLGTGNDFQLARATGLTTNVSSCLELRFATQPEKTVVGQTITDADYSAGGPVIVGLYNSSSGQPVGTCPSATDNVTISKNQTAGTLGGTLTRALGGTPCAASFDDLSIGGATGSFTLKATGLGDDVDSESFDVVNGTSCLGVDPCNIPGQTTGTTSSSGQATGGTFVFVAFETIELPQTPAGCAGFETVGADPLFIAEQRVALSGELFVTYGIKKSLIQKKYGNTSGQQFIPLCAGAKRIALVDGRTRVVDCDDPYDGKSQVGWWGKELGADGKFTGKLRQAICDPATGYFFGILGSFQDYTNSDACRIIDPSTSPTVVEWTSDTTYRYFKSRWPSSSAVELQKADVQAACPDPATRADFAGVPWDGVKFG